MIDPESLLPIAFRAWPPDKPDRSQNRKRRRAHNDPVRRVLVLDTETFTDVSQAFMFGFARIADIYWDVNQHKRTGAWRLLSQDINLAYKIREEICIHADDLSTTYPDGYETLVSWCTDNSVKLVSRSDFMNDYVRKHCVVRERKGNRVGNTTLAGFNLPFDLSRLAYSYGEARNRHKGEFVFDMFPEVPACEPGCSRNHKHRKDAMPSKFRPRLYIKHLDSKKSIISWGLSEDVSRELAASLDYRGQFLDLHQLIWGMTNRNMGLSKACESFGLPPEYWKAHPEGYGKITPEFIEYARQDVAATTHLCVTVLGEYMKHPIDIQASKVFSPASIGKAYLRKMGITPMRERAGIPSDPQTMGACVSAFYGGRAEVYIRRVPVPITVLDFTSMYSTVNTLMRLWDHVTAAEISILDDASEVRRFRELCARVAEHRTEPLFDKSVWPDLTGFAQIMPRGDVLPVRARYADATWNAGISEFRCPFPVWYTYADVLASVLATGRIPDIRRVMRFVPGKMEIDFTFNTADDLAKQQVTKIITATNVDDLFAAMRLDSLTGLRDLESHKVTRVMPSAKIGGLSPVKFPGITTAIDPAATDFFKTVVEQRQAIKNSNGSSPERDRITEFLKVLANSTSYGIYVEMLRDDKESSDRETTVYGVSGLPWECKPNAVEHAQEFCYPPIGAVITGAARLMLSILERLITESGGSWLFCDTDSMAVVTSETGELIPCPGGNAALADGTPAIRTLTRQQVRQIQETIDRLNPYDRSKVRDSVLKDETGKTNATGQVWGYAISAKRYCLFTYEAGKPVVPVKIDGKDAFTQHGLGMYLDPSEPGNPRTEWIRQAWQHVINRSHCIDSAEPDYIDVPAVSQVTVSTPAVMRSFREWNRGKPYEQQVKPFSFVILASETGRHALPDPDSTRKQEQRRILTPFTKDPAEWFSQDWFELYKPGSDSLHIGNSVVDVKTIRDVLNDYAIHREAKQAMPDGKACAAGYAGVLSRRVVYPVINRDGTLGVFHIGKESNKLESDNESTIALISDPGQVYTTYGRDDRSVIRSIYGARPNREIARMINDRTGRIQSITYASEYPRNINPEWLAETTRQRTAQSYGEPVTVDHKMVARYFSGAAIRSKAHETAIMATAAELAAKSLGIDPGLVRWKGGRNTFDPESVLGMWLAEKMGSVMNHDR